MERQITNKELEDYYKALNYKLLNKFEWELIQRGLSVLGYYPSVRIDGIPGKLTKEAYVNFVSDYIGLSDSILDKQKERLIAFANIMGAPKWIFFAINELGTKETPGDGDNPDVLKYLESVDTLSKELAEQDETPWCSSFVNWCVEQAGQKGTEKANARSWLDWGKRSPIPSAGDVVVLWRGSPDSWKGHVGFFINNEGDEDIRVLGGNQHDEVNISTFKRSRVLDFRTL